MSTSAKRWAVVAAAALSCVALAEPWRIPAADLKGVKNPVAKAATAASAARGAPLYGQHCAGCHGDGGKGDGPDGAYYTPAPADLTSPEVAKQSDAELFVKLAKGRGDMESFEKKLTAAQRWDVVNYLRSLK